VLLLLLIGSLSVDATENAAGAIVVPVALALSLPHDIDETTSLLLLGPSLFGLAAGARRLK
jgi:hypothetical protein